MKNTKKRTKESPSITNKLMVRISVNMTFNLEVFLYQIAMGLCRIGFLTTYMGDALVSGFTTGAAVHVFTSQVKYALGVKIPRFEGNFQVGEVSAVTLDCRSRFFRNHLLLASHLSFGKIDDR